MFGTYHSKCWFSIRESYRIIFSECRAVEAVLLRVCAEGRGELGGARGDVDYKGAAH